APLRATARRIALLFAAPILLAAIACGGDKSGAQAKTALQSGGTVDEESRGEVVIAARKGRYLGRAVASAGTISGTVSLKTPLNPLAKALEPLPPVSAGRDSAVCGKVIPDSSLQRKGTGLGNVVVWLEGVREGKPIPLEKRIELESDRCLLTPRVQATVVGSAVNVIGHDDFRQHLRFIAAGEPQVRAAILLGSNEQVIPSNLPTASPALVIVKDADHPWPRAYIAVFDHPYYAVTKQDGSFSIDGVPPGKYTLVAWHERTGKSEQAVEVASNGTAKVNVELEGK
ncbi:MAG: carboxypeptidase-like regulatory domain-containing protein, partial [Gemmatimonadaceae bacterium]